MSTGAIIAIVIGALILIALAVFLIRQSRERRLESMRHEAREHRDQAQMRARTANREQADADEAEARARKARAEADEQAAQARRAETDAETKAEHARHEREQARELHGRATELDPDADVHGDAEAEDQRRFGRDADQDTMDRDADRQAVGSTDQAGTDQAPADRRDRTS